MDNFELPTNIKQIGTIDKGLRIYVEDYVFTFVQQFTQSGGNEERLAILVGRFLTIDSMPVLFISGAIEGRHCTKERGGMEFSEESYSYITDTMDRYFSSFEIVGWVQSQPGYGTYLSSKYYNYHMGNFKESFQVLYVTDPIQRLSTFYVYNDIDELVESKGYFVYYDKNKPMHEYMIDNKAQSLNLATEDKKMPDEAPKIKEAESAPKESVRPITIHSSPKIVTGSSPRKRGSARNSKYSAAPPQRLVNMLAGLCAVMFLVCFVMGAGLIRSDDRISMLEQNLSALNTAYRNLAANSEPSLSAFAQGNGETTAGLVVTEDGNKLLEEENAKAIETAQVSNTNDTPVSSAETPVQPSANATTPIPETYIVQKGDNLIGISQKIYGNKDMVSKIMEVNGITDPDKITFGTVLILPKP
ncbi:LysM peptidoglycan-binding domain-containing protein [Tyzzerella sp. OttesenSCG-928-J15]|nr:LysM peptidoglycan-binding domain-containing protein [Tyzzerella sp. OttesenSCG-928-J15]MDL2248239.1 LysM peptidoglycan-binding domain-containing protein [Tyzzerella sp. OttesenSCG-928-J15]